MKPVCSAYIPFYHENLYYTQNTNVPEARGQLHYGEPGLLHDPMVQCTHGGFELFTHLKHPQGDVGMFVLHRVAVAVVGLRSVGVAIVGLEGI